ncbi:hypothetical protein [uncultured Paraglaciecola sp.]|uniref:hypothetical protein n=1 Tax=uncultured Paraglaciecola sp. TaxID=1765024 RepID=UPI0030D71270|tara:strand:- start:59315 stop:59824 length:510 start_codon:yes stop_codon:yes gene_type:complete
MKFVKLTYLLASLGYSAMSYSGSCGKLIANPFVTQGDFAVSLEKHNGKRLNIPKMEGLPSGPVESSGFALLQLTPGLHEFKGFAICTSGYCERSSRIGGGDADGVKFAIKVEAGKSYKIAARPAEKRSMLPGKRFDVFVMTEQKTECEGAVLEAISNEDSISQAVLISI